MNRNRWLSLLSPLLLVVIWSLLFGSGWLDGAVLPGAFAYIRDAGDDD